MEGFKILDMAIKLDESDIWFLDKEILKWFSVSEIEIQQSELLVRQMNVVSNTSRPLPKSCSWTNFGLCVVSGFTGIQVNEIRSYVNWNSFGYHVKSKNWSAALNVLKSGVRTYMARHGAKAAGRVALKQIINASGVGFAAQAGAFVIGCAALQGWRWFWK